MWLTRKVWSRLKTQDTRKDALGRQLDILCLLLAAEKRALQKAATKVYTVSDDVDTQLKAYAAFYFLSPDCPSFKGTTIRMANGEALLKPHEEQVWIIEYMQTDPENSVGFPSPQDLTAMKRVVSRLAYHMKRIRAEIKDIIKGSIENGTSIDILAHTMSGISALSGTNHKPTLALANRMAMMRAHHRSYKGDNLKYWDALDTNIAKILDGNALDGQHQRSYRKDLRKFPMPPLVAQTYTPVNECTQLQRRFDIAICRYRGELHARQLAAASAAEAGSVVVGSPTHPASPSSEG
ncbi:hypothetical protein B9479_000510 [Cryptococcus floricola]|uniref:Uncharacterized protein n=1 Tax=Cryptococcus floricola TaxID=2591691 RepID=A0A5D3B784_9TREE|nr:hypothetical protein B9479_000510 [Cryptococcus floricola]